MESTWLNHVKYPKLFNQWHNEFNIISEMCSFKVDSQKSVILSKDCLYLTVYSQTAQVGKTSLL